MDFVEIRDLLASSLETMGQESDRGCLLVGLATVDETLGDLLAATLKKHGTDKDIDWLLDPRPGNRPLASLAVRTRVARCLGLINDETRNVIDRLRTLRNKHAHGISQFDLTDEDAASIMQTWTEPGQMTLKLLVSGPEDVEWLKCSKARKVLHCSIVIIIANLMTHHELRIPQIPS